MITGTRKERDLTVEKVLEKITEYDIFRFYMPYNKWELNRVTYSPFRNEKNPSFLISSKHGFLYFIDFADTSKRGNCFEFLKLLFGLSSMQEVLLMINKDFGLALSGKTNINKYKRIVSEYVQPKIEKKYSFVQVLTRKFTNGELEYWNKYHQDIADLKDNNIYAAKKVFLNKQLFPLGDNEFTFGYYYEGHWKIYRPFKDKKSKWVPNNVPITAMDGMDDVKNCKVALINKSKKDYMVMKKIFPNSCAVQNEGLGCFSVENVDFLKANSEVQLLSFDSDDVGVKNSQQITKIFDFGYINVPKKYLNQGIKDWADLAREHGMKIIEEYFKQRKLI